VTLQLLDKGKTALPSARAIVPAVLFLMAGVGLLAGCSRDRERPSPQLQTPVVSYQGGQMSLGDWLHSFRELSGPDQINDRKLDETILQLTHEWVAEKVLAERARTAGLDRDPKMVDKIAQVKDTALLTLYIRNHVDEEIVIRRKDLKQNFDENQDKYQSPSTYTYYRIYFSNEKGGKDGAKQRAEECWTHIDRGANFHEMLDEYSDTRPEKKHILYGPFKAGELPADIEQVILQTPLHRHSPVVELPDGYMIIYPEAKTDPVVRPFSLVEAQIYREVFGKQQSALVEDLMNELTYQYRVVTHKDLFDKAEVSPQETVLEINPGNAVYSWDEFMAFANERKAKDRAARETELETFARRKLVLHHAKQNRFDETDYFRRRYLPLVSRILSDYFLETNIDAEAEPSEADMEKYYDDNPGDFRRQARIEAWHLARKIRYPMDASEKERVSEEQKVLGQLFEIRKRIAEQGESFVIWADRFTEYEDRGYLGWVPILAMPPEWTAEVAKLEEGEISQPIRVKDTFELVLRGGIEEPGTFKYEAVKDKVRERAKQKKIAELRQGFIEHLLTEIKAEYQLGPVRDMVIRLRDRAKHPPQYWLDPYQ
jgi:parvulin-like peptidyl-prolyl isomerase